MNDENILPCSLEDWIGGTLGVPEVTCLDLGLCRAHQANLITNFDCHLVVVLFDDSDRQNSWKEKNNQN